MKLERWGDVTLLRPDPQVIWRSQTDLYSYPDINAVYHRSEKGGGGWQIKKIISATVGRKLQGSEFYRQTDGV